MVFNTCLDLSSSLPSGLQTTSWGFDFWVLYLHGWCYQYNISTRNPKTHYVTGKPEDDLIRWKHCVKNRLLLLLYLYLYVIVIKTILRRITSRCVKFEYIVTNYSVRTFWLSDPPMFGDYFYTCPIKINLSSLSNYLCFCITRIRWGFRFNFFSALWVPIYDPALLRYSSGDCTEHWLTTFKFFCH